MLTLHNITHLRRSSSSTLTMSSSITMTNTETTITGTANKQDTVNYMCYYEIHSCINCCQYSCTFVLVDSKGTSVI